MKKIFGSYTTWIILINVIAFIIMFALIPPILEPTEGVLESNPAFEKNIAINWNNIAEGRIWTLVTSMFAHANFTHLFVNMLSLLFIGSFVEKLIGKKRYLGLYILAGIAAGLIFVFLSGMLGTTDFGARIFASPFTFAVGASGAIFGLGGLLAVLTPKLRVLLFFIIPMPMWIAIVGLLVVFWILSITTGLPIGNTAHLGGLLIGVSYGYFLKKKYPKKTKMISKYFEQ